MNLIDILRNLLLDIFISDCFETLYEKVILFLQVPFF